MKWSIKNRFSRSSSGVFSVSEGLDFLTQLIESSRREKLRAARDRAKARHSRPTAKLQGPVALKPKGSVPNRELRRTRGDGNRTRNPKPVPKRDSVETLNPFANPRKPRGKSNVKVHTPHKRLTSWGPSDAHRTKYSPPPSKQLRIHRTKCWSCTRTGPYKQRCVNSCNDTEMKVRINPTYKRAYNKSYKEADRLHGFRKPGGKSYHSYMNQPSRIQSRKKKDR